MLFELLSGGTTGDQILADYADLEPNDLRAVHAYAARLSKRSSVRKLTRPSVCWG